MDIKAKISKTDLIIYYSENRDSVMSMYLTLEHIIPKNKEIRSIGLRYYETIENIDIYSHEKNILVLSTILALFEVKHLRETLGKNVLIIDHHYISILIKNEYLLTDTTAEDIYYHIGDTTSKFIYQLTVGQTLPYYMKYIQSLETGFSNQYKLFHCGLLAGKEYRYPNYFGNYRELLELSDFSIANITKLGESMPVYQVDEKSIDYQNIKIEDTKVCLLSVNKKSQYLSNYLLEKYPDIDIVIIMSTFESEMYTNITIKGNQAFNKRIDLLGYLINKEQEELGFQTKFVGSFKGCWFDWYLGTPLLLGALRKVLEQM